MKMTRFIAIIFLVSGFARAQTAGNLDAYPNILWICTDQQSYNTINTLNNPEIQTPNLNRLSKMGVAFTRAYSQSPVCTPSRVSFLTGLYPSAAHQTRNGNETFPANERVQLITKRLSNVGYDCALVGKLHIASPWNGIEARVDDGYRKFYHSLSHGQGYKNGNEYMEWLDSIGVIDEVFDFSKCLSEASKERRASCPYLEDIDPKYHQTTWCVNKTIDFINEEREGPWMVSLNLFDPHPPYDAPLSYKNKYDIKKLKKPLYKESDNVNQEKLKSIFAGGYIGNPTEKIMNNKASYYGMITLIDEQIGRLFDLLEKTNELENTVIIFTSDHGNMTGDHGINAKGCRFYESAVRVPLIISWPGHFQQNKVATGLTQLIDIVPTIAEIVGIPLEWVQGNSLVPILSGKEDGSKNHDYVRCEYYDALDMNFGVPGKDHEADFATMFRNDQYKLVVYHNLEYGELYDLKNDPDEFNNLWENTEYADVKNELMKASFDATVKAIDVGPKRIGRF